MRQDSFVARHEREWVEFAHHLLTPIERRRAPKPHPRSLPGEQVPQRYRRICQHLAIAIARGYSPTLIDRLQRLVQAGHRHLYRTRPPRWAAVRRFFVSELPAAVRREWLLVWVAAAVLFLPGIVMHLSLQARPEMVLSVLDANQVAGLEAMYSPTREVTRTAADDAAAFGGYVLNNASIGFRTFASGLLAGVGTVLVLLLNGVLLGTVTGHLTAIGSGEPLWSFVAGHSAPELIAVVLCGASGLRLGLTLIAPGRQSRRAALVEVAREASVIVLGAALLFVFAAFIEAYWSPIPWIPPEVKYAVGLSMWATFIAYFAFFGRR